jgi:uncharacterized protein YecT (DUF1311 family)
VIARRGATMRRCAAHGLLLFLGVPVVALAQPAFNCAKAQGEVEQLICANAALGALDRQLDAVYKAAMAKAQGQLATRLRADQRGWVKGRNDCWKANGQTTWITANWTVDSVEGCIAAQYRLRTSELQAVWRLQPPKTVSYVCGEDPANELVVNFFETDPPTVRLERGDRTATLWRVTSAGFYEGQNVSLVQQATEVKLDWLDVRRGRRDELRCRPR